MMNENTGITEVLYVVRSKRESEDEEKKQSGLEVQRRGIYNWNEENQRKG